VQGFIGVLPIFIGSCFFFSIFLFGNFRFKSSQDSLMTMFYTMQGDAVFDVLYGSAQFSVVGGFLMAYYWINFGIFIFNKVGLAQVEEGYIEMRESHAKNWLTAKNVDPGNESITDDILK
jgi:hypothetical protein